jgi:sugar/nucleoside kinase (ribokinase family)
MPASRYDVLCLGNAIVDVICTVEDDVLVREAIAKGSMTLINEARAEHLYGLMTDVTVVPGGSAANTAVGVASFGARAAFIGKVKDDEAGRYYAEGLEKAGVHFGTAFSDAGPATARSFILVTPDGQRSMNTYLGACQALTVDDVDLATVQAASVTYLEGYLWDPPAAKDAFKKAAAIAHEAGRSVAITLSDSFCVDRYRSEFLDLIRTKTVDLVFSNESELHALYQTADTATAMTAIRQDCGLAVVTLAEKGAAVLTPDGVETVPAVAISQLVDTTGAGDLFAAGFLTGFSRGLDHVSSARLGVLAAAEVIQHVGAHPKARLAGLAEQHGLKTAA